MSTWRNSMLLLFAALFTAMLAGCGGNSSELSSLAAAPSMGEQTPQTSGPATWPAALPSDTAQPWEQVDAAGHVIPNNYKASSALNANSDFVAGVERYTEGGTTADNGEATSLNSAEGGLSWSMYRVPLGSDEPGVVTVDANLTAGKGYYVGLANYGSGAWDWHGPFSDNHVRISTADASNNADYTSDLGSVFACVVASDGAACDVIGIGVDPVDAGDTEAPPAPDAPTVTAVNGGLELTWTPVISGDLAGYCIYSSGQWFFDGQGTGVKAADSLEGLTRHVLSNLDAETYVRISAVDISGNESSLSDIVSAEPLAEAPQTIQVMASAPSGALGETINITATGADSYDFDTNGDGTYDITGDTTGMASVDTTALGIIRPTVRGTSGSGTSVALGGVSVIISGNSRPVADASASPTTGVAPLDVTFSGDQSTDFDGTIVGGGWDFDGDGTYDVWSDNDTGYVTSSDYTYNSPGVYNAKLRVVDDKGAWDVDTAAIVVGAANPGNEAPTANLQADVTSGDAPLTVSFDASGASDSDGTIVRYRWDWDGDGLYDAVGDSPLASHTYTAAGSPEVKVQVEDNDGAVASATLTVTVNVPGNDPPTADLTVDQDRPLVGQQVSFDASGSSDGDGSIVLYEWDFDGDGNWDSSGSSPTAVHTYGTQSGYDARVRVTDNTGAQATAGVQLAVTYGIWTMRGHDTLHSGRSPFVGSLTNTLKWSYTTGNKVRSSPAVAADGTVYVGSDDNKLHAINPDGTLKWSYITSGHVWSSPAIGTDGTVYVTSLDHKLYAINPDGNLKWTYITDTTVRSSPAIGADGTVYVGSEGGYLYAINPDGSNKWVYYPIDSIRSSPAIGADGTVYVGSNADNLYALNPDGSLKWSYTTGSVVISSPAIGADGTVYVGSYDHKLYALNPDGTLKWSYTAGDALYSSPAIGADGTVYVGSLDSKLYAVNPDGTLKWSYTTGGQLYSSPAIGADGRVYVGSNDNKLYAIKPDGSIKWSYNTGDWVDSSPAIGADGTVYVGSYDHKLYAIWDGGGSGNSAPTADLAVDQDHPLVGQQVSFDASGSFDSDGSIVLYEWDFDGDGNWDSSGSHPSAVHTYGTQSGFDARVRVTDNIGAQATAGLLLAATHGPWTMRGHDTLHGGRSPYVGAQTNALKWSFLTGNPVRSSPAIGADGTVYVGSDDFKLYAFSPNGGLKWSYTTGGIVPCSPAIGADGTVYVGSWDKKLYAINPNGTLKWSYTTLGYVWSSPAIAADGTVYVGTDNNKLYALNPDGSLKWIYGTGHYLRSSPAIGADGTIYVGCLDDKLYAIKPNGSLKWSYTTGDEVHSSPAIGADGTVYVGSYDNKLYAINPNGSLKWSYTTGDIVPSSPAIGADGTVYVGSYDKKLYAINPNGSLKWSYMTADTVRSSPAIGADGTVYVGSYDNKLYAINPDGTWKWSYVTAGIVRSSPAIGPDGAVYVGSSDHKLYAFGA